MKKKIYFAAKWNKSDITKTWSGTSYSLYRELSELHDVERINIPNNWFVRYMKILTRKTQLYIWTWILDIYTEFVVNKQIKDPSIPVFSIGAFRYKNPYFIYVDDIMATYMKVEEDVKKGWGYNPKGRMSNKLLKKLIDRDYDIYKKACRVFCMGKWLTEYAQAYYKDNISSKFIHAGGGANSILQDKTTPTKRHNTILYVGRDHIRKDLKIVVDAYRVLRSKRPDLQLIIAGPKTNPLKEEINGITFLGDIPYEEVAKQMLEADVFCMPSRFEAYGLVFIESLIAGVPCVARDAYEMKYFIEDHITGRLLKNEDANELSEMIDDVLNDNRYISNINNHIESLKTEYNWRHVCESMMQYIDIA